MEPYSSAECWMLTFLDTETMTTHSYKLNASASCQHRCGVVNIESKLSSTEQVCRCKFARERKESIKVFVGFSVVIWAAL